MFVFALGGAMLLSSAWPSYDYRLYCTIYSYVGCSGYTGKNDPNPEKRKLGAMNLGVNMYATEKGMQFSGDECPEDDKWWWWHAVMHAETVF